MNNDVVSIPPNYPTSTTTPPDPLTHTKQRKAFDIYGWNTMPAPRATMKTSLKLHRLQRGMKQSDLADLVNVRRETIGRLEQGQYCPSLRLAMDLARVFGTTVEDLFSFDDEYESESE